MKINKYLKKALSEIGRIGGKAGKGKSKVRGDSEYYRKIRSKRKATDTLQRGGK